MLSNPYFSAIDKSHSLIGSNGFRLRENENVLPIFLISLLTLTTFLILYVFRSLDDNRLVSWQWVFTDVDILKILFILVIGVFGAYLFSRISLPGHWRGPLLFISSFAVGGIFWGEPAVIVDTSRYFVQAKHLELYGVGYFFREWGKDITAWTDLPLMPLFYGLIFDFFGEDRLGIQVFTTLLFSGTVILTHRIGKALWDETVGLYAGVFLLGMPYLLTQVPLMLVDVPTMFFLTLAIFTTIMAIKHGGAGWLGAASGAIMLALLSKYSTWLMLSVIPVIFLCHLKYGWKVILQRAGVIALGAIFLVGMVVLWKFDVITEQLRLLQSYQVPGLKRWQEGYISTFFFQIHPFITIAALCSVYVALRKKDWKYAIIGWMLLLVVVLEIKRIRYIILVFPMLALMAAYGLREIKNLELNRFIISCTVVSAFVIAILGYLPFLQRTSAVNIKEAGEYLNSIDAEKVEVFVLPQIRSSINPTVSVPILDLFTKKIIIYHHDRSQTSSPGLIKKSSLRFTWEYKNPQYFTADTGSPEEDMALVVVFSDNYQPLPGHVAQRISGLRLAKELDVSDKVFKYKTIVRVYQPV